MFPSDLEIANAVKLEMKLIKQFKDKCLEEAIPGKILSNEYGDCYHISVECSSEFGKVDYNNLFGFCKNEDLAIIDIETLGLSFENPIILLGMANINKTEVYTHQFLLRDISDEPGAIWSFLSHLKNDSTLITYNGRKFDVPYIKERAAYHGIKASLNNHHYDILHFARRALHKKLPNCCLGTVEEYFGIQGGKEIPGGMIPLFYKNYLQTRNVGPLVAIVEHNKQDLINLGIVVSKLYNLGNFRSRRKVLGTDRISKVHPVIINGTQTIVKILHKKLIDKGKCVVCDEPFAGLTGYVYFENGKSITGVPFCQKHMDEYSAYASPVFENKEAQALFIEKHPKLYSRHVSGKSIIFLLDNTAMISKTSKA